MQNSGKLCGIDEAGRGPLAGPLVMAGVVLNEPVDGLDDSKALSEKRRETLYMRIVEASIWHIVSFDAQTIDEKGISACLIEGLKEIMAAIPAGSYLFDGNTTFGLPGLRCQIKADMQIPEVSAASILAKVTRDRIMQALALQYPAYGFEKHKGYGTKAHVEAIATHGLSPVHRRTFKIKSLQQPSLF
ncbi:ribonuclease HII [Hydrogenimonas sp. SS33]|uniref:ribonuclease HII n=1 Tax=Hydrogenimonas leucolamina TaxID=2954236 RepID=UPI00336BE1BA